MFDDSIEKESGRGTRIALGDYRDPRIYWRCIDFNKRQSKHLDLQNTEVAVLNEVKTQSFTGAELTDASLAFTPATLDSSYILAALAIAAITSIFVTWHISRLYHNDKWSKKILHKSYAYRREPIVDFRPREVLHEDQDAIFERPLPDGRITDSWLPPKAQKLYENWGRGKS